ncbi:MAG: ribbon-helix-helix protein, CopG family [Candidatus Diapherotrites archaeon]|nr:ribbon-helix-helix protein, CopG family [Candidatus Diapherotrites archaeon]
MNSVLVNLRLEKNMLKEIDLIAKKSFYKSRTEFIREALRKLLEEQRTKEALKIAEENFGRGKREGIKEPTKEEMIKIKEKVGNELLKKHGLL